MSSESPYAVFLTGELQKAQPDKQLLLLPLTVSYLLSEHIRVFLPVPEKSSRLVDSIFDEIIKGLTLKSQGVGYLKDLSEAKLPDTLQGASLVLTTDEPVEHLARDQQTPCIYLAQEPTGETTIRSSNLVKLMPEDLKVQAVGFVQLISVLSSGVLSKGHFSLSW